MRNNRLAVIICFFLLNLFCTMICSAQENFGSFIKVGGFSIEIESQNGPVKLRGFCFGDNHLYAISWEGYLVKIDTAGNIQWTKHTGISSTKSSYHGAICFDQDTLWIFRNGKIFTLDINGILLETTIDLQHLGLPYLRDIGGIIKEADNFWLIEKWTPLLFQINRDGNLIKHYVTSWLDFSSPTIANWEHKILKITDSHSPTNIFNNIGVLAFDKNTGTVTDAWDIPRDFTASEYLGISKAQSNLWAAQFNDIDQVFTVHRLSLPEVLPPPEMPMTEWGDFKIVDWSYCPITPAMIEGLYGFGYDQKNKTFWLGNGIYDFVGAQETAGQYLSIVHFSRQSRKYDIAVHNDTLWGVHYWAGLSTASVSQMTIDNNDVNVHSAWETGLEQIQGIATDGKYIWVSGRDTFRTTSDRNNHIKKFDRNGNQLAHFIYPDEFGNNYEDLTWHQDGLWAITHSIPFGKEVKILKLDFNTGEILESFNTGWLPPGQNVMANLASDGNSLITIATTASGTFDYYEKEHTRILKLQPTHSPSLIAGFSAEPRIGSSPLSVQFTDSSSGEIQSWYWDFGDGETSIAQNPLHVYTSVGTFTVSLTINGQYGTDTLTREDYITVLTPCLLGDVNMDENVSPGDALCAFQIYLNGGTPPQDACDTDCALEAGDINCEKNGISPGDALYIFKSYLEGKTPPLDCDPSTFSKAIAGLELSLSQTSGNPEQEIAISIRANNPRGLKSFGFDLGYPDELLSFVKVSNKNLTENWQALDGKQNVTGTITLGGFNPKEISSSKPGILLEVIFKVKEGIAGSGDLWLFNLTDDVANAEIKFGKFSSFMNGVRSIENNEIPKTFALKQNYPNPFNMKTEINYQLPEAVYMNLTIYNSLGHKIRTLVTRDQNAGYYTAHWDGRNELGKEVTSGIYIYRLETSKYCNMNKMLLVK